MATAELVVAFGAKIGDLEAKLQRVTTALGQLQTQVKATQDETSKGVSRMGESWQTAVRGVRAFTAAYAGLAGLRVAKDVVLAVDDINASFRRLQAITGSSIQGAASTFAELRTIAAQTGQPLADLTNQFQRFFVATSSIGATREQVSQLIRTLAGFAQLSGQGPQEAAAAITQLAQGLASGKLQGDELKSILENMPQLAVALSRELGVSVGELRKMGEEGRLTTDRVFPALLRAAATLQQQLNGLPLTIRQAWQVLSDRFVGLVAEIDRRIGASQYIQQFLAGLGTMAEALRVRVAGTGEGAAIDDRVANLSRQAAEATANLSRLENEIRRFSSDPAVRRAYVQDPNRAAASGQTQAQLQQGIDRLRAERDRLQTEIAGFQNEAGAQSYRIDPARAAQARAERTAQFNAQAREWSEAANPILKARREHGERMAAIERREAELTINQGRMTAAELTAAQRQVAQAREDSAKELAEAERSAGASGRAAAEAARVERERQAQEQRRLERDYRQGVEEIAEASGRSIASLIRQYREWGDTNGRAQSSYTAFMNEIKNGTEQSVTLFEAVRRAGEQAAVALVRSGQDPQPAIAAMTAELNRLKDALIALGVPAGQLGQQVADQVNIAQRTVDNAAQRSSKNFDDIKKSAVESLAKEASDSIIEFATTGEEKFAEVAENFVKMIAKMILNLLIFRAVVSGLGALGVTIPGLNLTGASYNPDATGVPSGADAQTRAGGSMLSPYFSGSTVPVAAASDTGQVTVNVYNNAPNTKATAKETTDSMGNKRIEVLVEEIVRGSIASGKMDAIMQQSYGLSRPGRV